MNKSIQDLLPYFPLHQLTILNSLPKKPLYYDTVNQHIQCQWLEEKTLLIIETEVECKRLNEGETAKQLIQDPNLVCIVFCFQNRIPIDEEILLFFQKCGLPCIRVENRSLVQIFFQRDEPISSYSQVSMELAGFKKEGFTKLASKWAEALDTPFLYLNEEKQLLWQTGEKEEIREATRWLNANRRIIETGNYLSSDVLLADNILETKETSDSFDLYYVNITDSKNHALVVSSDLMSWQRKIIDKLVGLTAISLQTEEVLQEQQERFKEHFIYDLLYHKFESKRMMVKQGKTWGWNLEKPHHLIILNIELPNELMVNMNWFDEINQFLESDEANIKEKTIVFPFQDQIILLIEDEEVKASFARKNDVKQIMSQLEGVLSRKWPDYEFIFGIGKWYQDTTDLNKSYQEAKIALQFGRDWFEKRNIFHINDLGILSLLSHVHGELLSDFSLDYLSDLIKSDREHETEYIKTLQVFFQYNGIINEVSDALHVHPNTLRKRLKKIEEITGCQLNDSNELMNLTIAVRLLSFINI